jgi:hypothetical protein
MSLRVTTLVFLGVVVLVIVTATALATVQSHHSGKDSDATSTTRYLSARYEYERQIVSELPSGQTAIASYVTRVGKQCHDIVARAPRSPEFDKLMTQMAFTMAAAGAPLQSAAVNDYSKAVARLQWSDEGLTRLVRTGASAEEEITKLRPPNLCGSLAAWVASGYHTLPATTLEYLRRVARISTMTSRVAGVHRGILESDSEVIMRMLRSKKHTGDENLIHKIETLEINNMTSGTRILVVAGARLRVLLGAEPLTTQDGSRASGLSAAMSR